MMSGPAGTISRQNDTYVVRRRASGFSTWTVRTVCPPTDLKTTSNDVRSGGQGTRATCSQRGSVSQRRVSGVSRSPIRTKRTSSPRASLLLSMEVAIDSLMAIRLAEAAGDHDRAQIKHDIFSRRYLIERPLLKALDAERAHRLTIRVLSTLPIQVAERVRDPVLPQKLMGISFFYGCSCY